MARFGLPDPVPPFEVRLTRLDDDAPFVFGRSPDELATQPKFTFEVVYHGTTVLSFVAERFDVTTPGFAALNEMVERANASVEQRTPTFAP